MANSADLVIKILTDASGASAGIDEATGKLGKFNGAMSSLAGPAAGVVAGVGALGAVAVNAASDLEQAVGGVNAVFGESAGQIQEWASQAATSVGLSEAEYSNFASVIGAQLKNLGVPFDQVAGATDDMISLGADLAATYGGTTQDAVDSLSAALRGEADSAEKYGLSLNATKVNAELAAAGLGDLEGDALTAAKAQMVMQLATEQAGGALGQFERESGSLAGSQQRLTASWENAAAALGEALLPIITPVVAALGDFAQYLQENAAWITPLIGAIGALAAIVVVYTAAQAALNAVMYANPIGLVILAVVALVAAFVWLWNTSEGFRNFFITIWDAMKAAVAAVVAWFRSAWAAVASWFQSAWASVASFFTSIWRNITNVVNSVVNGIRSVVGSVANWFSSVWQSAVSVVSAIIRTLQGVFTSVFNAIMAPIRAVVNLFNSIVGAIQNVIAWLGRIKIPDILGSIGSLFSGQAATYSAAAATAGVVPLVQGRALTAAVPLSASSGGTGGGGTVINVVGGLDSADAIARRVRQLLNARDRRANGVRIERATR